MPAHWIDLLDPSAEELRAQAPRELAESAVELLLRPAEHEDEPRPTLHGHGDYVFGVFLAACTLDGTERIGYQEIDLVLTHETLLTVRKTPERGPPFDPTEVRAALREGDSPGMIVFRLVDGIAESYLDLIDAIDEQIDGLEDVVDALPPARTRERISAFRHQLLHVRRTLTPMRDAVRRVIDDVAEVTDGPQVFPHDVEIAFNCAYDKLLRATDGLELARDLLGGVRDYAQAKIANDQNEVMKRLTAIASLLLLPTFIVGLYGQNFDIPELHWRWGYGWSWALIAVTTVLQLWYFRRKRWI